MNPVRNNITQNLKTRILRLIKVDPKSLCWLWQGATSAAPNRKGRGYGYMLVLGKKVTVRRLVYKLWVGDPGRFTINSICGNSLCVNPGHLSISDRRKSPGPPSSQEIENAKE